MKKIILSLSLIFVVAGMGFQPIMASNPILKGISKLSNEDRDVKNFNAITAGGPIQVIVTLGNTESLRFEGDAEAISTLITEVKGNVLIIRPEISWTSWARKYQNKKIVAYVSAKTVKALVMSGDGSITVKGTIKGQSLATTLSGSGSITAGVDVSNFAGVMSGSGILNISGTADEANITISGSGNFAKKGFTVGTLSTVISGSGSVNITAQDKINAIISGSGSVNYSGNAEVEQRVSGSGRIRKV